MGVKNLKAYPSLNSMMIVTMGLGLTTLFFLGIFSSNINKELNTSMSNNAPHYFFLGIQKSELKLFTDQIHEIDYKAKQIVVPMISARIEAINNKNPRELVDDKKIKVFGLLMVKEEYPGLKNLHLITQLLKVNGGIKMKKIN